MAVGVENHYNDITGILVAIISHKFFSAFALGVSLVKAGVPSRRTIQLAASFAASTPSGIVIGILMTQALVRRSFGFAIICQVSYFVLVGLLWITSN